MLGIVISATGDDVRVLGAGLFCSYFLIGFYHRGYIVNPRRLSPPSHADRLMAIFTTIGTFNSAICRRRPSRAARISASSIGLRTI